MRFKRIIFRNLKSNRYSIVALCGAILSKLPNIEIHEFKNVKEINFPVQETVIAYSLMTFDIPTIKEEIKILKERGYTLIAGGPHPSADPNHILSLGFDYVFLGDGEENIIKFLKGEIEENKIFDGIKERVNLDDYPPFCFQKKQFMPMEISRGCPFRCGYCQTPYLAGKIMRHRSIENILYYAKIGVKHNRKIARFISSNAFGYMSKNGVTPNLDAIEKLLKGLKEVGVEEIYFGTFPSDVRPESVTDDVLKLIKKYVNNKSIVIGAQSGSDRILKLINRGHTVEKVEKAIEKIYSYGFIPKVDIIFGFPFETDEDLKLTEEFINRITKKYNAKIHAHTFMPLPGTKLWNIGEGRLSKKHYKIIGKLAAQGVLDGYWQKQVKLSELSKNYIAL